MAHLKKKKEKVSDVYIGLCVCVPQSWLALVM